MEIVFIEKEEAYIWDLDYSQEDFAELKKRIEKEV